MAMKKLMLIVSFLYITLHVFSQEPTKTRDVIYLENGNTIETRIIRVSKRNIYYYHPKTFEIVDIKREKVTKYEFNDEFFQTNLIGKLDHREVVCVEDYKKDEIYRAIKDWFVVNSRRYGGGVFLEDTTHRILLGTVNTSNYFKMDFITVVSAMSTDYDVQTYSLYYDVNVRIKDNRFKIYITNFEIKNNNNIYEKPLLRSYEKRKTKEGVITVHGTEIINLKKMIAIQIYEIKEHCELVRKNDTYHNRIVKFALSDDDW